MPATKETWSPTVIRRFVDKYATATEPVEVETDQGRGFLKALGNRSGPHVLACELVGTQLASWFGLRTFDFTLIKVTDDIELPLHSGGTAQPGPAFITRGEKGTGLCA